MITERTKDYLNVLGIIIENKGYAQAKDISRVLGVSPSSVTEMFQKLSKAGYICYKKYGGVTLTSKGKNRAKKMWEKYNTLNEFLLILGVNEEVARKEACKMEHVLNRETMDRLSRFVEFVQRFNNGPIWLDHFKIYYETGNFVECALKNTSACLVHGGRKI